MLQEAELRARLVEERVPLARSALGGGELLLRLPELRVRLGVEVRPEQRGELLGGEAVDCASAQAGLLGLGRSELLAELLLVGAEQVELRGVPVEAALCV